MNRRYRSLYNEALGVWVAAPETAKGKVKGGRHAGAAVVAAVACSLAASGAWGVDASALPTGGTVTAGAGSIAGSGTTLTVNQASSKLAIDWQSFNIGSNATVNFVQPSSAAIALNRVVGSSASEIYGHLNANGQVFLLNPNGVLFGKGAEVNVGGLVATTLSLSNADFLSGNYRFTGTAGSVVNEGTLAAADGGYVALLGGQVGNRGSVAARLGSVVLAAGSDVTLDFAGDGLLSVTVNQGAMNALAENKQLIQADGGLVLMTAKAADSLIQAVVNNEGVIEARTIDTSTGSIRLLADMDNGIVKVGGRLDTTAGSSGGFIETSGKTVQMQSGAVVQGKTWLIDPTDITIDAAAASTIASSLDAGTNVTETTSSGGTDAGNITVASAVTWTGAGTLTLTADNNIAINAAITGTSGGLTLSAGNSISAPAAVNVGTFDLQSGTWSQIGSSLPSFSATDFRLSGGTFIRALGGDGSSGSPYQLADIYGVQGIGSSGMLANYYTLANNIDASGTPNWNNGHGFNPIGNSSSSFTGSIDGQNHAIDGLTIVRAGWSYVGLFGFANSATISNLGLSNVHLLGGTYLGGLVGFYAGKGTISNSYVTGSIQGDASGMYALMTTDAGGLVGYGEGAISGSYFIGAVTNGEGAAAGLVGELSGGTIDASYATGTVTGGSAGGLVVSGFNAVIRNSYFRGTVSGYWFEGGLLAVSGDDAHPSSVVNSYFVGELDSDPTYYGSGLIVGFCTYNGATCGNSGTSYNQDNYAVQLNGSWAPLCGNNYALCGSTLLTETQLKSASTFSGGLWDISSSGGSSSVWRIYDGYSYPLLRSFLTSLTITATGGNKTYDGTTDGLGVTYSSSYDSSLLLGTLTAATSSKNVGDYTVTPSGLYSTSQQGYDISYASGTVGITAKALTVSGTTVADKTYDGTTMATLGGGSLVGLISGDTVSLTQAGTFADKNVGTGKAVTAEDSLSGTDAGNYSLTQPTGLTATISAKVLSITGTTVADKTYDGTTAATATVGTLSGFIGSETVGATGSGTFDSKNAGTRSASVVYTLSDGSNGGLASNYSLADTTGLTATISAKALSITGTTVADKTYDGTTAATLSGGSLVGLVSGDTVSLVQAGTFADKNAGTGKAVTAADSLAGADAGNYSLTQPAGLTAAITPATLTVTAYDASKTYDGLTYAGGNGVSYAGFGVGDDASVLGGSLSYGGTAQGARAIGRYTIAPAGLLTNGNYRLVFVDGHLTVQPPEPYQVAVASADDAGGRSAGDHGQGAGTNPGNRQGQGLQLPEGGVSRALGDIGLSVVDGGMRLPDGLMPDWALKP